MFKGTKWTEKLSIRDDGSKNFYYPFFTFVLLLIIFSHFFIIGCKKKIAQTNDSDEIVDEGGKFVGGLTSDSITFGGLERSYIIYVPKSFDSNKNMPLLFVLHGDSRSFILNQARDIFSFRTHPQSEESMHIMVCCHDIYDDTRCPPGYHVLSPIYIQVPPPEYHRDGPDAVNKAKWEIAEGMIELLRKFAPNMTEKNIVAKFINTPLDSEFRNTGLIGGNWYAIRECEDQWWSFRPIPELARYRTPIHKLYLCHQTSYPGGLCLLAVPYNLMHILIDDGAIEKPEWFIPSPYHISDGEKRF